jgi:hypothetical protein
MIAATAPDLERDGYAIIPGVIGDDQVDAIGRAIDGLDDARPALRRDGALYGMRDALRALPEVRRLAHSEALLGLVRPVLGDGVTAVRALLFDKTPEANWGVPWHQDLTIAVKARSESLGFGPWTVKAGFNHVRPPVGVLERMLTLRVHLDDCGHDQGPLLVIAGSHREGRVGPMEVRRLLDRQGSKTCLVGRGGVVMIRPLILHASTAAESPRRRRVVHLEYAADLLPGGLEWFESVNERL